MKYINDSHIQMESLVTNYNVLCLSFSGILFYRALYYPCSFIYCNKPVPSTSNIRGWGYG